MQIHFSAINAARINRGSKATKVAGNDTVYGAYVITAIPDGANQKYRVSHEYTGGPLNPDPPIMLVLDADFNVVSDSSNGQIPGIIKDIKDFKLKH